MEELKKELQIIYPEATIIDIHNMIQDLTDFCLACANATIQEKQKQVANDNEKIPEKVRELRIHSDQRKSPVYRGCFCW